MSKSQQGFARQSGELEETRRPGVLDFDSSINMDVFSDAYSQEIEERVSKSFIAIDSFITEIASGTSGSGSGGCGGPGSGTGSGGPGSGSGSGGCGGCGSGTGTGTGSGGGPGSGGSGSGSGSSGW